jgi:hypothetical protein
MARNQEHLSTYVSGKNLSDTIYNQGYERNFEKFKNQKLH